MTEVRTRFAPSPTGFLHVGGIRTALFAYLVAKQSDGTFVLRLEDTDKSREVAGSREHLLASLKALHLDYDEGPDISGDYGPYVQSERLGIYAQYAQKLIDAGLAYADPYTSEEIQSFREKAQAEKRAFRYRDYRPEVLPAWDGTKPLRFKSTPKSYTYRDEVMGDITTSPEVIDDLILIKSDGYPTYNFAHIVDDAEMQISHVIRGQEFISSMPNFLALYEALGLERPIFAHMPHIMNEQGNKKLGKRDGAKDVLDYIRDGYLPETLDSFIATLGWNDGTEQEVFTMDELVEKFDLSRVQKSGARFDEKRLLWMNAMLETGTTMRWQRAQAWIGHSVVNIDTPSLVIDLDAMERNMARMAGFASEHGVRLRPHAKMHKSAELARLQMDHGAVGVCVQKTDEALALAHAG
ncbi:glutamate--tRNA ligase, partial [Candidatus Saccharibacteria bacterium 32-49-10]